MSDAKKAIDLLTNKGTDFTTDPEYSTLSIDEKKELDAIIQESNNSQANTLEKEDTEIKKYNQQLRETYKI